MKRCWIVCLAIGFAPAGLAPVQAAEPSQSPGLQSESSDQLSPSPVEQYLGCESCGKRLRKLFQKSDPACRPEGSAYSHISCPFEVYFRTGPGLVVGGGRLSDIVDTGYAVEAGAKGFLYDQDFGAAWTGSLGIDYIYNNFHESQPSIWVGEPATPRELHRISASLAFGREWYFGSGIPGDNRWMIGADIGGRLGNAHAKYVERDHQTNALIGVFVGAEADLLIPRNGYDIVFGGRFEWGHDWFEIIDESDNLGQIKLLLKAGLRY